MPIIIVLSVLNYGSISSEALIQRIMRLSASSLFVSSLFAFVVTCSKGFVFESLLSWNSL